MERAGLKILNTAASPLHFRAKTSIFRPFLLPRVEHNLHFPLLASSSLLSPLHSLCIRSDANTLSNGDEVPTAQNKLLQVVLVSPQIPGNTGSIARTCAASAVGLHLVEPLGFPIDNTKLKRAGLDYWPYVVVKVHRSWDEFREYFMEQAGEKRLLAFTKRGTVTHSVEEVGGGRHPRCGLMVNEMVENPEVLGSKLSRDKNTRRFFPSVLAWTELPGTCCRWEVAGIRWN